MKIFNVLFTATGETETFHFTKTPALTDFFEYKNHYYMVVDYDGKFVHVVKVTKLDVIRSEVTEQNKK